jgi:hypothetical protein
MHKDGIFEGEEIAKWRLNPENKKHCVRGDDRSPAWTWTSYVYHEGNVVGIPSDNLMTMLREGGAKVPLPGGRANETFKKISQSGLLIMDPIWEIASKDGVCPNFAKVIDLKGNMDFQVHCDTARKHGFSLFAKRAKVGMSKHIRVRPMWSAGWTIEGDISILDDKITDQAFLDILSMAGRYCGLCDWRPSSPAKPGPYGTFTVKVVK